MPIFSDTVLVLLEPKWRERILGAGQCF